MQCLRRRFDFRRCLAFLLPPLLLMLYQLLFSEYTSLYPDARLYLSIADNFLHTGHFIQTDRAGVEIVVPFAYPLYITLLRAVGMPLVGFAVLNLLSVGASSVFLYDTERRLFGSGGVHRRVERKDQQRYDHDRDRERAGKPLFYALPQRVQHDRSIDRRQHRA